MRSFRTRLVLILLCGLVPFFLISASALFAVVDPDKGAARPVWNEGVDYLAAMLVSGETSFDVQKVSGLLDFVVSEKGGDANLDPGIRENATGAYFFSDVKAPLSRVVKYA